jgi:hypothetical protein
VRKLASLRDALLAALNPGDQGAPPVPPSVRPSRADAA